jgi:hypothetical protein
MRLTMGSSEDGAGNCFAEQQDSLRTSADFCAGSAGKVRQNYKPSGVQVLRYNCSEKLI